MTQLLRTLLLLLGTAAVLCAQVAQAAASEPLPADRIVAVVNDEVVTLHELRTRLDLALVQLKKQGTPLPPRSELEKQMLERLVMDKVQLQIARDTGLRIDDAQLDQALQRIAANNKMSLAQFRDALQADGIAFAKFREEIREEMTLSRIRERDVDSKIAISEGEIDYYLSGDTAKGATKEEYEVAHILLRAPESASPEQIQKLKAKAEQVYERLQKGEDWSVLASELSEDTSNKDQGGDLGWFGKGAMVPEFETAAFALTKIGEISQPVKTSFGYHIIQLLGREERPLTADELSQAKDQKFSEWLTEARKTAQVVKYDRWKSVVPTTPELPADHGRGLDDLHPMPPFRRDKRFQQLLDILPALWMT